MAEAAFFREDGRFIPTASAESSFSAATLHGGPPAGLLASGIESFVDSRDLQVARLTVDLFRPVPTSALELHCELVRDGRRIRVVDAILRADGVTVSGARAVLLRAAELGTPASVPWDRPPGREDIEASADIDTRTRRPGFRSRIEMRRLVPAEDGVAAVSWFRIPFPMIEGEELTPLVRLAATCDFVHGSTAGPRNGLEFVNVDSTISIQRLPAGEWICLQAQQSYESHGIGVASALIWDEQGFVGRGTQSILANSRPGQASP